MLNSTHHAVFFLLILALVSSALAQGSPPREEMRFPSFASPRTLDSTLIDQWMKGVDGRKRHEQLGSSTDSVSRLDLEAPGPARREYDKGLEFLMRNRLSEATQHLAKSISLYPSFVAAHIALGSAYLDLGQNQRARAEFAQAVALDDHLPYAHMNLGRAELALKHYLAAEESIHNASSIAPLDLYLLTALAYTQLLNHHYDAVVETVQLVHGRPHAGAAIVHYFGAAAWQAQNNLNESHRELQALLEEDPKSPAGEQARRIMAQAQQTAEPVQSPPLALSYLISSNATRSPLGTSIPQFGSELSTAPQKVAAAKADGPINVHLLPGSSEPDHNGWTLRSAVDEVELFFAATDHGKSVSDLSASDIAIRDNGNPPAGIAGFRRESQLPLRLGLVIDSSSSIKSRFAFEQDAAANFAKQVVADKNDLAFVVGFANTALLLQDFTADQKQISHRLGQLAPAGGTAAWDAVSFAAHKLASLQETQPVARILVVISDGEDNCSKTTLRNAIRVAEQGDVVVYAVSTREDTREVTTPSAGDRALRLLAERTGGAAFFPGYIEHLALSLAELQEVIRSRYLISYKPAFFKSDGHYRTIDITAKKSGHRLRVFARKGYFAPTNSSVKEND